MQNVQAAAVGTGTLRMQHKSTRRGRGSSTEVRQWELLTTKAAHFPDSPETLGSLGAAKEARGENSGLATGRVQRFKQVLRPGEGSNVTVDHGKPASKLRWEVGEIVEKRKVER